MKHDSRIPDRVKDSYAMTCLATKKDKYATKKRALTAASYHRKMLGSIQSVYKCPFCNYYHLTSQEQKHVSSMRQTK